MLGVSRPSRVLTPPLKTKPQEEQQDVTISWWFQPLLYPNQTFTPTWSCDASSSYFCQARKILPAAAFVLKNQREATDVALALNASVDPFLGESARWAAAKLLKERGDVTLSPAARVSAIFPQLEANI